MDDARSRRSDVSKPPPEHIDRYVPGGSASEEMEMDGERRPPRRRNSPKRDGGRTRGSRRPGQRRDRQPARDENGHLLVQGRPRKTAEELDAEMTDYWNGGEAGNGTKRVNAPDGDIDMDA
jgi:THO complex subunit 4